MRLWFACDVWRYINVFLIWFEKRHKSVTMKRRHRTARSHRLVHIWHNDSHQIILIKHCSVQLTEICSRYVQNTPSHVISYSGCWLMTVLCRWQDYTAQSQLSLSYVHSVLTMLWTIRRLSGFGQFLSVLLQIFGQLLPQSLRIVHSRDLYSTQCTYCQHNFLLSRIREHNQK